MPLKSSRSKQVIVSDMDKVWDPPKNDNSQDEFGKVQTLEFEGNIMSASWTKASAPINAETDTSVKETIQEIQQFMLNRPISTFNVIRNNVRSREERLLQKALPYCGYMLSTGPWKNSVVRFGIDLTSSPEYRFYQTVTLDIDFDPIVEVANHDAVEKANLNFTQFLSDKHTVSHSFDGKRLVLGHGTWQICDITDPLLRRIVQSCRIRHQVHKNDGFFWNGTLAKLEVIMRDKIINIRDGRSSNDDDYRCLLGFPDEYTPPGGKDYTRYGLEFGQQYTIKQVYLRSRILERARKGLGSAQSRPASQSNTPVLEDSLTDIQQSMLANIGNAQLSGQLYKRKLKIYTREEKLEAIDFYQTRKHRNPTTRQEHAVSIASAAEVLYVSPSTLKGWIEQEQKIMAMPQGSARADGERKDVISRPDQYASGYYPFLTLEPEELHIDNYISRELLHKLHPFDHPVPFIGIEGGRAGRFTSFEEANIFLGHSSQVNHAGHPTELSDCDKMRSSIQVFEMHVPSSYVRAAILPGSIRNMNSQEINSHLYYLSPNYACRLLGSMKPDACYQELARCVAFISQQMLLANKKLILALPIRIEFDYDEPFKAAPQQWALKLSFDSGKEVILPLALCLNGSVKDIVAPDTLYLQGWTKDHGLLACDKAKREYGKREVVIKHMRHYYTSSQPIFDKFKFSPVLHIADVDMLFLSKKSTWRPRRFAAVWILYSTILHTNYRHKSPMTPAYGAYMDIALMVEKVFEKGLEVTFNIPPTKPFQLVKLSQFTLEQGTSESDQNPTDNNSDFSTTKHIENHLSSEKIVSKSEKKFLQALHRAFKSNAGQGLKYVDDQRRCMYYSCPMPGESSKTYYCSYHTRELIKHFVGASDLTRHTITTPAPLHQLRIASGLDYPRSTLEKLAVMYSKPEKAWVMDFEFINPFHPYSPIPLQVAIRQIDGKLLYSGNVDYQLSMQEYIDTASPYVSQKHGMMGTIFLRCYKGLQTNGESPLAISNHIRNVCGYDEEVQLLSWVSAIDMQCFLRILTGGNGLIQKKISHVDAPNFQMVDVSKLCRQLFPDLTSGTLESVHKYLGKNTKAANGETYHHASYDTAAMVDIIKVLVELL